MAKLPAPQLYPCGERSASLPSATVWRGHLVFGLHNFVGEGVDLSIGGSTALRTDVVHAQHQNPQVMRLPVSPCARNCTYCKESVVTRWYSQLGCGW